MLFTVDQAAFTDNTTKIPQQMTLVCFQAHRTVPRWLSAVYTIDFSGWGKKHGEYNSTITMVQLQIDSWQRLCNKDGNQWRKSQKET